MKKLLLLNNVQISTWKNYNQGVGAYMVHIAHRSNNWCVTDVDIPVTDNDVEKFFYINTKYCPQRYAWCTDNGACMPVKYSNNLMALELVKFHNLIWA